MENAIEKVRKYHNPNSFNSKELFHLKVYIFYSGIVDRGVPTKEL